MNVSLRRKANARNVSFSTRYIFNLVDITKLPSQKVVSFPRREEHFKIQNFATELLIQLCLNLFLFSSQLVLNLELNWFSYITIPNIGDYAD